MEVVLDNGNISSNVTDVLTKWQRDFSNLLNSNTVEDRDVFLPHENILSDNILDRHISILEVKTAIDRAKRGKACGSDNIPIEVLKNDTSVSFLHVLFNICFDTGTIQRHGAKL